MASMIRRRSSTTSLAVAAGAVFATLVSCSSDSSDEAPAENPPAAETTRTAAPAGPCADGACELEVAVGDVVTVPEAYGLGPIEVKAITGNAVEMVAPLTGSGYSVSGCSGGGGVSSDGGGGVSLSCEEGPAATINDTMSLKVVEVLETTAVVRIEPAE